MNVEHAVIMAAGVSSRFAPLSSERPKALLEVRGEILIERQIRQLIEAGIQSIIVVTGYKASMFDYLSHKFPITLIHNHEFDTRNNNGSLYVAKDYLRNAYICSADNYFVYNPFESKVNEAYYSVVYAAGETEEWCVVTNEDDYITDFTIGGRNAWYMLGHVYFDQPFADTFIKVLSENYEREDYRHLLWESIYHRHIDQLRMKAKRHAKGDIFEFDTLDDLRAFDDTYKDDTRSDIMKTMARKLGIKERDMTETSPIFDLGGTVIGFSFSANGERHSHLYNTRD